MPAAAAPQPRPPSPPPLPRPPPVAPGYATSPLMRPLVVLALPGMYLFYKYNQYKRRQQAKEQRKLTERELLHLNSKIDKLLSKLEENELEPATAPEEECVICIHAKATMQTAPCGHQVVCRKCFVKTIQMAVSQRLLPLRCVVCRAKIMKLRHTGAGTSGARSAVVGNGLPTSVSGYSVASTTTGQTLSSSSSMPNSDSLFSVSSGTSSISGASSLSSNSNHCTGKIGGGGKCCNSPHCLGGAYPRQPTGGLRKSQQHAMKLRLQEYWHGESGISNRLPPIRELPPCSPAPQAASTRIRCAQKIVTQLEQSPTRESNLRPRKPSTSTQSNTSNTPKSTPKRAKPSVKFSTSSTIKYSAASATMSIKKSISVDIASITAPRSPSVTREHIAVPYEPLDAKTVKKQAKQMKNSDKSEKNDNKKNELAEKKREEKARAKAEKEAKREAKKEEERLRREAKEEKKRLKKEAKMACGDPAAIPLLEKKVK